MLALIERESGYVVIKSTGVEYNQLSPKDIVDGYGREYG